MLDYWGILDGSVAVCDSSVQDWPVELQGRQPFEFVDIDRCLDHNEDVVCCMSVHTFAVVAEIKWAIGASEPLALDVLHALVTYRDGMTEFS